MSDTNDSGGEAEVTFESAMAEALAEIAPAREAEEASSRPSPEAEAASSEQKQAVTEAGEAPKPAEAAKWSPEDDAALASLPPQAKALVDRRVAAIEADYKAKGAAQADVLALGEGVKGIVDAEFRQKLNASGMNEAQGLQYLANLERFASSDPAGYLRFVAQHVQTLGVDVLSTLGIGAPANAQAEDAFQDPRVGQLEQRLGQMQTHLQREAQARQQRDVQSQIQTFQSAKDAAGNPAHPHLDEVAADMAALLRGDPKMTLEGAYERAVWSNPTARQRMLDATKTADEAKRKQEGADAAKAARMNVRPGQRSVAPNQKIETADDAIYAALAEIQR